MPDKKTVILIACIAFILIVSATLNRVRAQKETPTFQLPIVDEEGYTDDTPQTITAYIYVQLEGAVNVPGVYKLYENARLFEAIHQAGGLRDDANYAAINQTIKLQDERLYYLPLKGETFAYDEEEAVKDLRISLSTASESELSTLPNIGPATARNIIAYRDLHGDFEVIEAVMNVSGIGEATFENIKEFIKP